MSGTRLIDVLYSYDSDEPWFKTVDWVPVTSIDLGGGYDWEEFHAWWSPSARLFYYGSGSGCSCNSFSDDYRKVDDFSYTPRKEEVRAAARRFVDGSYRSARDVFQARNDAMADIAAFVQEPGGSGS
jgi:hypothetical protein